MPEFEESNPSAEAIRQQLTKILQSAAFINSDRLSRFLHFTVDAVLEGNADSLKEYVIGIEAYDRKPPYHPAQDSIVRTEARRLRKKLKDYYEAEGKQDPVFIYFRPGTYVPVFRSGVAAPRSAGDEVVPLPSSPPLTTAIAILPFADASASPLATACAEGLTDELIHAFVNIDGIRVIDKRSGAQAASRHLSASELARSLGVQVIVQGAVRIEGGLLKITAQLVDADGFQIWSQRFEAQIDPQSFFPALECMASALVCRVSSFLVNLKSSRVCAETQSEVNRDIFMAEALLDEGTPDDLEKALSRCQNVIQVLPRYARAHAAAGACYCAMSLSGTLESDLRVKQGKEAVKRALDLDTAMVTAHSCLAYLLSLEGHWEEAEARFRYALRLGSDAVAERQFALFLCMQGRFDEAWYHLQRAERSDPFSHQQKMACSQLLYFSREFDEIERRFAESSRYGSQPLENRLYLALSHARSGRLDQAITLTHTLKREIGARPVWMSYIAEILALCGQKDESLRLAQEGKLLLPHAGLSRFRRARLLLALEQHEAALSALSKAADEREAELVWLAVDPGFDAVRDSGVFCRIRNAFCPKDPHIAGLAG